jgi:DNA transposition AAA+ family ATPase
MMSEETKGTVVGEASAAEAQVAEKNAGDTVRASWPFSLHQIRINIAHCAPEGREALVSAFLWCTDPRHSIRRDEFSRRVGYSENTIYRILSGKYIHSETKRQLDVPDDLVKAIHNFLDLERERFLGGKTEFVKTPTAARIWHGCNIARESRSPVFIWGVPQIGKTTALERYAQDNNHGRTVYVRMKAASGLGGMVRRIAENVGVSPKSNTANLTDYIKGALTQDMVLILDEVHLLAYTYRKASFFGCMEVIREIFDETHCGLVLCGTQLLQDELTARELEQLLKRGVHRIALPAAPTRGDVSAILEAAGLEFPDRGSKVTVKGATEEPYQVIRQLAKKEGLKAITERLRYGRKLAARRKETLSWEHFVEAHLTIAAQATADTSWN